MIKAIKDRIFVCTQPYLGSMDDPYVDLANIALFNCRRREEEKLLLQFYLGYPPSVKEGAKLSLLKQPIKIFYGLEFLRIASIEEEKSSITEIKTSKSYRDFGSTVTTSHPANLLQHAVSLLNEVIDYSQSEQYVKDLAEV